mgnify:CR=1 FL=1
MTVPDGMPPDNLRGEVRPRQHGQAARVAHLGLEHLHGQQAASLLDALRADDHREIVVHRLGQHAGHVAHDARRRHDDGGLRARQGLLVGGRGHDARGKLHLAQVARVRMRGVDGLHHLGLAGPQPHLVAVACQQLRECRPPRPRPDNRDLHVSSLRFLLLALVADPAFGAGSQTLDVLAVRPDHGQAGNGAEQPGQPIAPEEV